MADPELHAESQATMAAFTSPGVVPYHEMKTMAEARKAFRDSALAKSGEYDYQGNTREIVIPSEHCTDGVPVTVHVPATAPTTPKILVYFHGGCHVIGARELYDTFCKMISSRAGVIVVNVEYRLAPEHKFPAMMDDAETAVKWVIKNKVMLGGADDSLVGVAGDSAGGNSAASVCHAVTGVGFQILIYPILDWRCRFPSHEKYGYDYPLSHNTMNWAWSMLKLPDTEKTEPRLSPLCRETFAGLPPALLIVAEIDMLADDSFEYAKKLKAAGVQHEVLCVRGALHGFACQPAFHKELSEISTKKIVEFIEQL